MFNKKFKKYICISVGIVGTSFVGLKALAKYKKGSYIYQNSLKEQNPFEGKKVIFVNDENVKENADGVSGYLEEIGDSDFVPSFYDKYIKRTMDVVLSFGGLVVLSPVFAGVALAIMIEDPGPVFFTQKRVGQNKKYFTLHKFRSMKLSTPHDVPTHQLENPEQYITKIGKFIRAHSLDELPQIWDIFVGNMSVIGPRPALWNQDLLIAERDKYNANDVKPGLTGWAQINGRDELEIEEKARLDGEYVQKESLLFDTKCFIGTISKVGHDDSVVEGGTREMSEKKKWDFTTGKSKEELIGNIGFGEPVEVDRTQVKKVLITGAGSYIGEAFENYTRENYADNFQIDTVDMLDDIWRTKDFSKYDIVYHVAGIAHADVGNVSDDVKQKYYEINTGLTLEVAEKAKKEGVKEFVFMSSMIVYGDSVPFGKKKVVDETTLPVPANFYGNSKFQADVAVREMADEKFKVIVLRPPMIYGKGSKGNYPILAKMARKLPVFPEVINERSMLHIDNLCEFLCQIMLIKLFTLEAVVLIPQNPAWTKTSDMVKKIAEVSGKRIITTKLFTPAIKLCGKIPGKISDLVNKAFGNSTYALAMSQYEGTVADNEYAIGYVSLGSLNDSVKALKIDGAEATAENIENGSYKVSRPFNIAVKKDLNNEVAKDFMSFIMSTEGQKVVADEKYIAVADVKDYAGTKPSGSCVVGGSSSVSPLMEKLIEAYKAVNPNASIELQTSDSTTGMTSTIEGSYDIGMASRELKEEEAAELEPTVIATDGIAVIVNNANPLDELSADQVKDIYVGNVSTWDEVTK